MSSETTFISSSDNKNFKRWFSLLENKGIKKHQQFLISGEKVVLESPFDISDELIVSDSESSIYIDKFAGKIFHLTPNLFAQLDIFGTNSPLLIKKTPVLQYWPPVSKAPTGPGLTVLCPMGDPGNLGTFIRSALAFNVTKIVLLKEACNPFHPKCTRATSGTIFSAPLFTGPSIHELQDLVDSNWFALDTKGISLATINWPYVSTLLIGEEGPGIPQNLKVQRTTIPISSTVESLNATIAASIACANYHLKVNKN